MSLDLYVAFVAASALLIAIPGPNVALIVANSVAHGARYGLMTVAGTASAMVVQLALVVLGASAVLGLLAELFDGLRWLGVAYLVWLGMRIWRSAATDLQATAAEPRALPAIFIRGFAVSLTNPKTLIFYAAFLPQFVRADAGDARHQLLVLAGTFLVVAVLLDGTWALLASRLRGLLRARARLRNRLTGGLLIGAGIGLAFARK
ncbi:MAG: lysine transporter LysE [Alphaproteobacteria bacterium 65-37]|jgi:threonine/homoserine/homoserine lactone efflux protein|nr:LysE family translocator [Alphaproteobacteria bacterium]OJU43291.1 MAG: lysine transporter LysE [Alphaproteobacteria bacterium 65-37]